MRDEVKVSIVAAICTFGLAVIFKNVLHEELNLITMFSPVILYLVYTWSMDVKSKFNTVNVWMGTIVIVTIAIIALYAF
ncbi:MAG: hypothetical protein C5S41_08640 [Candidatus Methanomarinus sp.]|jgi:hypothetical protein|nr:MAG: hypothetical protein C5S41_08640 [ANME-2 cluster archaeon]